MSAVSLNKQVTADDYDSQPMRWNTQVQKEFTSRNEKAESQAGEEVNDNDITHDANKAEAKKAAKFAAEAKKAR